MASRSVNLAVLVGHLGKDAETTFTPSGKAVTKFSIATSHSYKKGEEWVEETTWHNIVLWGGEKVSQYLTKGTQVYIQGRISNRSYEGTDGTKKYFSEVVADTVNLLGGKTSDSAPAAPRAQAATAPTQSQLIDNDVPF